MVDRSRGRNARDFMLFYGGESSYVSAEWIVRVFVFFPRSEDIVNCGWPGAHRACALSHLVPLLILEGFIIRGEEAGRNEVRCV